MKKRIMGIVLTAVMLAAVLSGCGNSTAAPAASTAPSAAPAAAESAAPAEKLSGSVSTDGSVMDSLGNEAKENKVSLELCGGPAYVWGVRQLVSGMVYNLCDNAIKYNRENGSVKLTVSSEGEYAALKVSDTGIGIQPEHQSRVFERFYRVDKSHSKEVGGTGLGLSIVKHSAMVHNAKIDLQSTQGKGTSITVRFPKA